MLRWHGQRIGGGLAKTTFFDRYIVNHFPTTGRLGRNPDCVAKIPLAEDEPSENDVAIFDLHIDMLVIDIGVGMQRGFHARCQVEVRLP